MKKSILMCAIIIHLTFAACGRNATNQEFQYKKVEVDSRVLTESDKSQTAEEQLINRLQATIELFEEVNKAVITIDSPNETEKIADALIITESEKELSDEQKTGIINIIKNSIGIDFTVTVNLKTEQSED